MTLRSPAALLLAALMLPAATLHADDAEDAAAKAVEKLGGKATRDDADPAHPVAAVSLAFLPVPDARLKDLAAFKSLRTLDLTLCIGVTDAGMKHVAALNGLEALNVGYTGVTDAGLKRLAALKGLRTLNLVGDKVTDDGVAALQKALPECKIDR